MIWGNLNSEAFSCQNLQFSSTNRYNLDYQLSMHAQFVLVPHISLLAHLSTQPLVLLSLPPSPPGSKEQWSFLSSELVLLCLWTWMLTTLTHIRVIWMWLLLTTFLCQVGASCVRNKLRTTQKLRILLWLPIPFNAGGLKWQYLF